MAVTDEAMPVSTERRMRRLRTVLSFCRIYEFFFAMYS